MNKITDEQSLYLEKIMVSRVWPAIIYLTNQADISKGFTGILVFKNNELKILTCAHAKADTFFSIGTIITPLGKNVLHRLDNQYISQPYTIYGSDVAYYSILDQIPTYKFLCEKALSKNWLDVNYKINHPEDVFTIAFQNTYTQQYNRYIETMPIILRSMTVNNNTSSLYYEWYNNICPLGVSGGPLISLDITRYHHYVGVEGKLVGINSSFITSSNSNNVGIERCSLYVNWIGQI